MKRRKKSLILMLSLCACLATASGVGVVVNADNKQPGLTATFTPSVQMGEVVELPDYYAEIGGDLIKATANVIAPNGSVYAGTRFTAAEAGRYTVEYIVDGVVVHTEYCMAEFGAEALLTTNALANVEGIRNYAYYDGDDYKGVAVHANDGGIITFKNEIMINKLTKNDLLFEGIIEPETKGEADCRSMTLTFTDATDDSIYFKVNIVNGNADGFTPKAYSFINVAANGQVVGGMNYDDPNNPKWQQKDIYGTSTVASFHAELYNDWFSNYSFKLYYDPVEKQLYTYRWEGKALVADFDDVTIFSGTAWSGFKSDRVKMSISFNEVKENGATVIVNEVGGVRLTSEKIIDDVAPEITLDLGGESKAPNALLNTEYTVFPYTVYDFYDVHAKTSVSVVYKNLLTGQTSNVSVKDGKFVTDKIGEYTIRYEAVDYSGNVSVKEETFQCIAQADDITLSGVPASFSAMVFGTVNVTPTYKVQAYGGLGSLTKSIEVVAPDGTEVALIDNAFVAEQLGIYYVTYTATDFYGNSASETLSVTVQASDETLFMNDIVLPDLLMAGFEYTLPAILAKTCYNGTVVDCTVDYYVNDVKLDASRTFTASGNTMQIRCVAYAGSAANSKELSKTVTVVDGKNGADQTAYFYDATGKMTVTEEKEYVVLTASENTSVEFMNKLRGDTFSLGVFYKAEEVNFSSFNVVLCDAEDSTKTLTLKFELSAGGVMLTTPNGVKTAFPSADGYFKMELNSGSGIIYDANSIAVTMVDTDDAGNSFDGFGDGIYAKMAFNGVNGESRVSLSSLNNQMLGYRADRPEDGADTIGPEMSIMGEIPVKAKVGDKVTVHSCKAYDVLSQVTSVTVRVQAPSGTVIVQETEADRPIEIDIQESGYYRVVYTAYDSAGQQQRMVRNIRSVDSVKPTLSVDFADVKKKVGDVITLPTVTANDDSGEVSYDIFLSLPNSEMRLIAHSENGNLTSYLSLSDSHYPASFKVSDTSFKLEMKGKYTLTVMAYDGDFNITQQSFTITVA